ncbi:O-antigen ligase family protein [Sphingobium boeckii]|uniref:O-antigen ligase-related domain-containing protein n=1 Tax=Sphingobium boeckii TaxID=1082345 RepID=A0A7W9AJM3_9SPHN|nr:O-antigen ligase family protein [Sphingobium boeckii]MBB5686634.1 hypothetical protein [Sphingobium boeckii]
MRNLIINLAFIEILSFAGIWIFLRSLIKERRSEFGNILYIISLSVAAFSFLSPNLIFLNIFYIILIPLIARNFSQVAPIYIFCIIISPLLSYNVSAGGIFLLDYSVAHSLGIGAIIAFAIKGKGRSYAKFATDLPFIGIMLVLFFITVRDTSVTNILREFLGQALLYGPPYWIVSRGIRNLTDVRLTLLILAAAAVLLSIICAFEALKGWPLYRAIWSYHGIDLGSGASVKLRGGLLRSPGPYAEPLSLSFSLTMCILALVASRRSFRSRLWFLGLCAITAIGIAAPQSRGAWIGLIVGLLACDAYRGRWQVLATRTGILVMAGVLAVAGSTVNSHLANLTGTSAEGHGTIDYREDLLTRGIEEVRAYPLIGRPFEQVTEAMKDMTQGEGIVDFVNSYLVVALVSGLIGLAIFSTGLISQCTIIWQARVATKNTSTHREYLAFAFSTMIANCIMLANISMGGRITMTLGMTMAMAGILINLAYKHRRSGTFVE